MEMLEFERKYWDSDYLNIAGIDEAGRGPLAGPVVASAVIFPHNIKLPEVTDSKKISEKKRERLFQDIYASALSIGVGIVHEDEIDEKNILQATYVAMRQAIGKLSIDPDMVLIDGNKADVKHYKQKNIINGDQKSLSIAAASIIAKVTRDRIMRQYDLVFPEFGFAKHKGYGTKKHMEMIANKKASPIHRKSFNPVSKHLPTFAYIKRNHLIDRLGRQILACHLIRRGHDILCIEHDIFEIKEIDIISRHEEILIFTKIDTMTLKNENEEIDSKIDSLQVDRVLDCIHEYMEDNKLDSNFHFNMSKVFLGKGKPEIKMLEKSYKKDSIEKVEEHFR